MNSRNTNLVLIVFFTCLLPITFLPSKSYAQEFVIDCDDWTHSASFWRHRCVFQLVGLPESVAEIDEIRMDFSWLGTAWTCGFIYQVMDPGFNTHYDLVTTIEYQGENLQYAQVWPTTSATKYGPSQLPLTWNPYTTVGIGYVRLGPDWITDPQLNAPPATGTYSTENGCS